jgi:hypothetical protein
MEDVWGSVCRTFYENRSKINETQAFVLRGHLQTQCLLVQQTVVMFFQGTHLHVAAPFVAVGIPSVLSAILLANRTENARRAFMNRNVSPFVSLGPLVSPLLHHFLLFPWIWLHAVLLHQGGMCIGIELRCCCTSTIIPGPQFQVYFLLSSCSHLSHCCDDSGRDVPKRTHQIQACRE